MGRDNIFFLELLEWFDSTGQEMVQRLPETGSGEIKWGAQLIARESQAGVFFYNGKAVHVFGPGRHTLKTGNIPVLNKILAAPWGFESPLRAEAYFVNMKIFPGLKWGTRDPVAFKDSELGLIRMRAFGMFNIRVVQPLLFINSLIGTVPSLSTENIEEYLSRVIVSRLNDFMGENLDTILDLPGQYEKWADALQEKLREDFSHFGLALTDLFINSITPPPEVQEAMDDKSKMGLFSDMQKLMHMKAAMSMEKAAENQGTAGEGMGMGMGFMMPAMMNQFMQPGQAQQTGQHSTPEKQTCPDCGHGIPGDAGFCPYCGHQVMVVDQCRKCGKNLAANARFCPKCGTPAKEETGKTFCSACGAENLPGANFCNSCGERI
ncbi:MAG: SPFH domain-containing protein [Desulfovibrionales bacterium]